MSQFPVWLAVLSDQLRITALVRPLPHQLANPPQAPPRAAPKPFPRQPTTGRAHAVLPTVSGGYPPPRGRLPTCSSPVRHVTARRRPRSTCMH